MDWNYCILLCSSVYTEFGFYTKPSSWALYRGAVFLADTSVKEALDNVDTLKMVVSVGSLMADVIIYIEEYVVSL